MATTHGYVDSEGVCTAKVTVTIADQDGVVLERFRVVGEGPDDKGAKGAEAAIGKELRACVEERYETEDLPIVGPFDDGDEDRHDMAAMNPEEEGEEDPYGDLDDDFFDHDDC